MRGVYNASIAITSLSASKTLIYITAASNKPVEILSITVTNYTNETNEQLRIKLANISSLGTPTKTDITPTPLEKGDQAAAATVAGNVTASEPTYGTDIRNEGFSTLSGWNFMPSLEERPIVQGGSSVGVNIVSTPTSFDCLVNLTFREMG